MFNARKIIFGGFGLMIFIAILIFSYSKYSKYTKGPEIISANITNFISVTKPSLKLKLSVDNTRSIKINNREIILKEKSQVNEILVFSPGDNIIEIVLKDYFGKTKSYIYHVFYKSDNNDYPKTLEEAKNQGEKELLESEVLIDNKE